MPECALGGIRTGSGLQSVLASVAGGHRPVGWSRMPSAPLEYRLQAAPLVIAPSIGTAMPVQTTADAPAKAGTPTDGETTVAGTLRVPSGTHGGYEKQIGNAGNANGRAILPPFVRGGQGGACEVDDDNPTNAPTEAGTTNENGTRDQLTGRCPPATTDGTRSVPTTIMLDSIDFIVKTFLRPQALLQLHARSIVEVARSAHVTIADDGNLRESPDQDSRACCELIDGNERFVLHSMSFASGVTPGRNLLVEKTHRPFLLILDDDFCFTAETKLQRFWDRLQSNPERDVVAGAYVDVVGNERRPA